MKYYKIIIIIAVLIFSIKIPYAQEYFPEKPIRFYLGFETNTLSTEKTYSHGYLNYEVNSVFLNGYGLNSEVEFPFNSKISFNVGLNFQFYLHRYEYKLLNNKPNDKFQVFTALHPTIEFPAKFDFKFKLSEKDFVSLNVGASYYSYIYSSLQAGSSTNDDSIHVYFYNSPDELIGDGNDLKGFNISANLGISYYRKLKNHEYLRISFMYKRFMMSNPVTTIQFYKNDNPVTIDKFKSYIHGLSLNFAYSFSQKNNFEEVYKKGIKKGMSL